MGPRYQATSFMFRGNFFGDYIESQYYNHLGGKKSKNSIKGVRLVTGSIYAICYSFQNVFPDAEIKKSHIIRENYPLLICRDCFISDIKIPTSGGSSNAWKTREKGGQKI